jgi:hypothetical protein
VDDCREAWTLLVKGFVQTPTGRERMGSPTLQTLQEPILLLVRVGSASECFFPIRLREAYPEVRCQEAAHAIQCSVHQAHVPRRQQQQVARLRACERIHGLGLGLGLGLGCTAAQLSRSPRGEGHGYEHSQRRARSGPL